MLTAVPAQADAVVLHDVIVTLRAQADPGAVSRAGGARAAHRRLLEHLRSTATNAQRPVQRVLSQLRAADQVGDVTAFWITDSLAVRASDSAIRLLRSLPQVLSVDPDVTVMSAPMSETPAPPEPNLTQIGAPTLWAEGLRGQGVVVAVLDSGVDLTHPDLASSYRGGTNSWFDPYGQHTTGPVDLLGHGTWTTGVVVGGAAGGTAIGVAPDASWIAARVFDDQGHSTTSAIHAALQWTVDPDGDPATDDGADVVNNSWVLGAPGCALTFQPDLQALRALDVVPVFAAGNGGPSGSTSFSPANYPEALSVGAVSADDVVRSDSSRGPSTCGGRARSFPDVTAPGTSVRTADRFGLWTSASGTSLAAPHATGALALLLSGDHTLTADEQVAALRAGAEDLGTAGPDERYGAGRIDAAASWATLTAPVDTLGPTVTGVTVTPDPTDLVAPAAVQAAADDASTGGSGIGAAELFVDAPGADGSGQVLTLASPGSVTTVLDGFVPTSLADGPHVAYVHAQDTAGVWGPWATRDFLVDRAAPVLTAAMAAPSPTAGAATVRVSVDAADPGGVASGTVSETGAGAVAFPGVMVPGDGSFGGTTEQLSLAIDVSSWRWGEHSLRIDATDRAGRSASP